MLFAAFAGESFPVFVMEKLSDGVVEALSVGPAVVVLSCDVFSLAFVATEVVLELFEFVPWAVERGVAVITGGFDAVGSFGGA